MRQTKVLVVMILVAASIFAASCGVQAEEPSKDFQTLSPPIQMTKTATLFNFRKVKPKKFGKRWWVAKGSFFSEGIQKGDLNARLERKGLKITRIDPEKPKNILKLNLRLKGTSELGYWIKF